MTPGKKRRIVIAVSLTTRPVTFEWIATSRIGKDFDLSFVLLNPGPTPFETNLKALGCDVHFIPYAGRRDLPRATVALFKLLRKLRPDAIHTHLVDTSLAGLTVARALGVPKRIHTRHHSDPYHLKHRHAVVYDRYANFLSTDIVAASENVRRVLEDLEGVAPVKIRKVPFGIRFEDFDQVTEEQIQVQRARHGTAGKFPVVGMVSRYLEIKGLQYAIPAFARVLKEHPGAYLVIANAVGSTYKSQVKQLLSELPPGSYREVAFEEDMPAFYRTMDVFMHVPNDPVSEAFGQAYTEALAAKLPCVFTLSGVAPEFIQDQKNALSVPFKDTDAIARSLLRLINDPQYAKGLALQGQQDVRKLFSFEDYIDRLYQLYR